MGNSAMSAGKFALFIFGFKGRFAVLFEIFNWCIKNFCLHVHQTNFRKYFHLPASSDSPPNSPLSSCRLIHIPSARWPMSLPPFHLAHELLLHYLHPSRTSHMPPTPLLCQLTLENDHIVLPFDPCPRLSEHTGPEAAGCSISLSRVSVGHLCDRWAAVSSSDPPCCSPRWDGVREHWLWCYMWQGWIKDELTVAGEDKRDNAYGWGAAG